MSAVFRMEPVDRPPHFEHMFELEREAFGLSFPPREAWADAAPKTKRSLIAACVDIYGRIVEEFAWDALTVYWPWSDPQGISAVRQALGGRIMVGGFVGGALWCIDTISDWDRFALDLFENPGRLHQEARQRCDYGLALIDQLIDAGAEMISLVHDVAFNAGPFCSPEHFDQFVTPYLGELVQRVKDRHAWAIVHSDGMLMPVLESMLSTAPHALHSIDPQAGMDIAKVKQLTRGRLALMGNVQCSLLQEGPPEAIRHSVLYCLEHASPGGGYIFSTSNTIFPGMPLDNYRYMLEVFHEYMDRPGG